VSSDRLKNPIKDGLTVAVNPSGDHEKAVAQAIRTFTKKVRNSGLVQELLDRRAYEKPSIKKKKKHIKAIHSLRHEEKDE
jgi:ribosomal protein S21